MPAFNFQHEFALAVQSGAKRQTIRPLRKRLVQPGQKMVAYRGLRTKNAEKLGEWTITHVLPIWIDPDNWVQLGTRRLDTQAEMDELARLDGFRDWFWMKGWFSMQYGLPFRGFLIQWGDA